MGPERKIETYLISQIKQIGGLCWKFVSPSHAGVPDRIIIFEGQVVFVELKSENGQLSGLQKTVIAQMRENGARVFVAWSKHEVDILIRSLLCKG